MLNKLKIYLFNVWNKAYNYIIKYSIFQSKANM